MITQWHCDIEASSSDCYVTASTTISSTSSPIYSQDAGNISFGLAVQIVLMGLIACGLVFNVFFKRK
ncbi:MAG: hypothetical protein A3C79_00795 [Candidatus Taylorbacteria bacterium RIFCSPHIGHO2_02_FULL_45_28]|uniref:Uncharacterized protein n=1 Tax=Candidatus Taylorbacteria bacterium RIFCSPHIGHO2_12_FULL_45_16 TaxID=1802315 RepID=A0A1G2MZG3_9BACT|nr:MAG: hypothetical protein A3C79_00795 [Candidatus Taylorbacteria bacterium RIFCSPHIGHO2_02_FULL_45_28]OHA29224.1 MAG: hypothetical protein A3F51_01260 [Candidatus Taylorbacteria bacterium RIFCSPHIGHO2_12_FULL_45_16]OHA33446.1 MAG: hypothetical protein A3A23_02140 [Candidatus Taylorbacteria bacterium RIFCSPLOWO2_01_FULL_45_59]